MSYLHNPPTHTSGLNDDDDDDNDDNYDDTMMTYTYNNDDDDNFDDTIKMMTYTIMMMMTHISVQTYPNLAAIYNELSSHSFMKVAAHLLPLGQ